VFGRIKTIYDLIFGAKTKKPLEMGASNGYLSTILKVSEKDLEQELG
jgi:hypothetical protein